MAVLEPRLRRAWFPARRCRPAVSLPKIRQTRLDRVYRQIPSNPLLQNRTAYPWLKVRIRVDIRLLRHCERPRALALVFRCNLVGVYRDLAISPKRSRFREGVQSPRLLQL